MTQALPGALTGPLSKEDCIFSEMEALRDRSSRVSGAYLESESNSEEKTLGLEGERPSHGDIFELQVPCT